MTTSTTSGSDFSLVLASSVHDMKNSLGMLLSSLEELIRAAPPQNKGQETQMATLQYEALRINTELVQLLAIYRMQENRLPLHIDECYLIDVLEDQVARNDMLLRTRNLTLELDCDEDLLWYFDAELVGGVVHNVLVNGARYSRERMLLRARVEADQLLITIADDGAGYPPSMLQSSLRETSAGVDFSAGNTHLGLYFARRVAEMHRRKERTGRIELANNGPLGGSVFTLMLP